MRELAEFERYMAHLCAGLGHSDRHAGLRGYCTGLMAPLARKSVEPMASHLAPTATRLKHQSLHHFVADSAWSDEQMRLRVAQWVVPTMDFGDAGWWIDDDTGSPKQGTQAVVLAQGVVFGQGPMPEGRRSRGRGFRHQSGHCIGADRAADQPGCAQTLRAGRCGLRDRHGLVPTRQRLGEASHERALSMKELAFTLPSSQWQTLEWREGTNFTLRSRFARVRVRAAHRDHVRAQQRPEQWALIEWPEGHKEPMKYWLSTLCEDVSLQRMVLEAKSDKRIERDYQDLKQDLGLGDYEGRGWRGFHHHASLSIAAYGFLMAQQLRHPDGVGKKTLQEPQPTAKNLPYPRITSLAAAQRTQHRVPSSSTSLRRRIAAALLRTPPRCPCCLRINARLRLGHSKTRPTGAGSGAAPTENSEAAKTGRRCAPAATWPLARRGRRAAHPSC